MTIEIATRGSLRRFFGLILPSAVLKDRRYLRRSVGIERGDVGEVLAFEQVPGLRGDLCHLCSPVG